MYSAKYILMKKVILILLLLPFISCSEKKKESNPNDTRIEATDTETKEVQSVKLIGVYEYVYEHNTDDFTENHYLEFKADEAIYYGTSDDFDDGREGYFPGFFSSKINDLKERKDKINFSLTVNDSIFHIKPVTPLRQTQDGGSWKNGLTSNTRRYDGSINGDTIVIRTEGFDPRVFVKMKK